MKRTLYLAFLSLFVSTSLFSQEEYLDVIATKTCDCIKQKQASVTEEETLTSMELGICVFESADEYKERIMEDQGIDLNNLDTYGEQLGELIGYRMLFICPEILTAVSEIDEDEEFPVLEETGEIQNITDDPFIVFSVKNAEGKTQKFYWLTFIISSFDLQNSYQDLTGKSVTIEYLEQELFDPRIKEYRKLKIITSLEVK